MNHSPPPLDPSRKWKAIAIFMAIYAVMCLAIPGMTGIACGVVPVALFFWFTYNQLMAMDNLPTKGMPFRQGDVVRFLVGLFLMGGFLMLMNVRGMGWDLWGSIMALAVIGLIIFVKAGGDIRQG